jgi:hypothetical protein
MLFAPDERHRLVTMLMNMWSAVTKKPRGSAAVKFMEDYPYALFWTQYLCVPLIVFSEHSGDGLSKVIFDVVFSSVDGFADKMRNLSKNLIPDADFVSEGQFFFEVLREVKEIQKSAAKMKK